VNRSIAGWIAHRWAKWVVLVLASIFVVGLAFFGSKLTSIEKNNVESFLPGDAEATKVISEQADFASTSSIPMVIVFTRDSGVTSADLASVAANAQTLPRVDKVGTVVGPIPSQDGEAVELIVPLDVGDDDFTNLPDYVDAVKKAVTADNGGLQVHFAGPASLGADQAEAFGGIDGILLFSAIGVVIVMLLLTYRSPILWIVPLLVAVMSVGASQGVVYLLAKGFGLTVNAQSAGILSVLVLGAGTDYALLLIARYREELRNYEDRHEAMSHALHRAGPAILASGATVVVGLLCLLFAQMNSTSGLGPVAAAGIVVALVLMLVLLPALMVILGRWVFWPFIPRFGDPEPHETGLWSRVGTAISRRPRVVWVATAVILGALSLGMFQLNATGLSNADSFTTEQPSVAAEKVVAKHFPAGVGSPVVVISSASAAGEVRTAFAGTDGIDGDSVTQPVVKGERAYMTGTLSSAPDSKAAFSTIDRVRDAVRTVPSGDALVGGDTAVNHDVQEASSADNRLIIPIILIVVLLILGGLLRSIMAPVVLLATVVLSFGAALGVSALVFRHVLGFPGADSSFPLFTFVFLVALGIDYNIFLMTRVREETLRIGTRRGALVALAATGGVITSAGLVLAGTFAALATLPIVFLAELGFAVAFGVLLDTIIVRSVLVTALNLDIGRWMWWPSALWKTDGPEHLADAGHPADPVATAGEPAHKA
jgi:RND superfamily putative drug exporter